MNSSSSFDTDLPDNLNQALTRHQELLDNHLELWRSVLAELQSGSEAHSIALKCLENTQAMISTYTSISPLPFKKQRRDSLDQQHKRLAPETEIAAGSKSKRRKANDGSMHLSLAPRSQSPSIKGFSEPVNSNHDNIRSSLQGNERNAMLLVKTKRRQSQLETSQSSANESTDVVADPSCKRLKTTHTEYIEDEQERHAEGDEAYYEEFEAKVELRLKEKEGLRKQKANKKRKRDSTASLNESERERSESDHIEVTRSPRASKQPRRESSMQSEAIKEFDSVSTPVGLNGAE